MTSRGAPRVGTGPAAPAIPCAAAPADGSGNAGADADDGANLSIVGEEDPGAALDLGIRTADEPDGAASRCGIGRLGTPDAGRVDGLRVPR